MCDYQSLPVALHSATMVQSCRANYGPIQMEERLLKELNTPGGQVITALDSALVLLRCLVADRSTDHSAAGDDPLAGRRPRVDLGTGFLVLIEGMVCVVTAAHVVHKLLGAEGNRTIVGGLDIVSMAPRARPDHYVRIPIGTLRAFVEFDGSNGLDFGLIPIPGELAGRLADDGAVPYLSTTWAESHVPYPQVVLAMGFPSEYRIPSPIGRTESGYAGETRVSRAVIELQLNDPAWEARGTGRILVARQVRVAVPGPVEGEFLADWDGMSGGPIVALCAEGRGWSAQVLAVQYAFDNGTAKGCFLQPALSRFARDLAEQTARRLAGHGG